MPAGRGAVHPWWLAPPSPEAADLVDPEKAWVAELGADPGVLRASSLARSPLVAGLFLLSAIGVVGRLAGPRAWRRITLTASALSPVLPAPFFDPSGWIGFAIGGALIVALLTPVPARLGVPRPGRRAA